MNPVIIAAGIYLSARIISFIAGELTESELKKQKEIDDEIYTIEIPVYNVTDKDKEYYNRAKEKEELQKCIKDYYSYKDREEK